MYYKPLDNLNQVDTVQFTRVGKRERGAVRCTVGSVRLL
jgi:hypothetical protein